MMKKLKRIIFICSRITFISICSLVLVIPIINIIFLDYIWASKNDAEILKNLFFGDKNGK